MSLIIAQVSSKTRWSPVEESVSVYLPFDSSPFVYIWLPPPLLNVPRTIANARCMTHTINQLKVCLHEERWAPFPPPLS